MKRLTPAGMADFYLMNLCAPYNRREFTLSASILGNQGVGNGYICLGTTW